LTLRTYSCIGAAALAALALAGCGRPPQPKPGPPEVGVVTLKAEPMPLTTELPGRTSPYAVSEVRPQVSGIVQARLFTEGANVTKGQPLYRIDPAPYRAALAQARGQLANAQASLTTAKLKAERYADLVKIKAVSQQDYDDAAAAYGQAQAAVQQGQAAVDTAEINLGYTQITAPISGRIGRSTLTQGALATSGQTDALTTIQQLDPIYVDLTQSSAELLALKRQIAQGRAVRDSALSAKVRLVLDDGSTYPLEGALEFTDVTVDPNSGSVTLRARFPNPDGALLPGMYARAQVTEALIQNAILAPQPGITRDPKGGATALVVGADGKAQLRTVQVGQAIGDRWLVISGLGPGDRLITEGLQQAKPGMPVRPVPAGSPPPPPPPGGPGQGPGRP
jgi:membrane fusion protein (multidrug efflux system)